MNTALNYVLIFGKLGFPAMGAAVVSLGLLSTAKYQRKAQRSGTALARQIPTQSPAQRVAIKDQIEAQRSGFDLERKNNTIGQSDAACGG